MRRYLGAHLEQWPLPSLGTSCATEKWDKERRKARKHTFIFLDALASVAFKLHKDCSAKPIFHKGARGSFLDFINVRHETRGPCLARPNLENYEQGRQNYSLLEQPVDVLIKS